MVINSVFSCSRERYALLLPPFPTVSRAEMPDLFFREISVCTDSSDTPQCMVQPMHDTQDANVFGTVDVLPHPFLFHFLNREMRKCLYYPHKNPFLPYFFLLYHGWRIGISSLVASVGPSAEASGPGPPQDQPVHFD
jgi:hypothetical protein